MRTNVDQLLEKISILDVVSNYVKLRKAGKDYLGLCPFHKEKTPSFSVSVEKQIYYCFGCHEGGNALNFIMKYENLGFQDALESLSTQYGIKLERTGGDSRRPHQHDALMKLANHYHDSLKKNETAMQYLSRRGIEGDTVDEFMLGYSGRQRNGIKGFLKAAGVAEDVLLSTGILRVKDGEIYDIFRGRIIVPIIDVNKKVIGFGGRAMEKDAIPKYINSPESTVFSKRYSLFGLNKARKAIGEKNEVFIVEGYFDLIALYMKGIENVVATLGTSITEGQLSKLRNYTDNITLMLDGDEAGIKSALRLIETLSEMEINGNMVVLPADHDPDSYIRQEGADGMRKIIERKKPILDYFFEYYMAKCKLGNLEGKLSFIKTVLPHVKSIRNSIKKRLYIQKLSELTGVEEVHFLDNIEEIKTAEPSRCAMDSPAQLIEKRVVGALLNNPGLIQMFQGKEVIKHIHNADINEVLNKMFQCLEEKNQLEITSFLSLLERSELRDFVVETAFHMADYDETESKLILTDYIRHVERKQMKEEARRITERLSEAEKKGDDKEVMELLQQKRQVLASIKSNFI
ncbi:MAG TPA: DNA primase [Syntrophorhabdaceae bacterium]|jgi:DNA primase